MHAVDYDSFVTTYLPAQQAKALIKLAQGQGLTASSLVPRRISLSWHEFDPFVASERHPSGLAAGVSTAALPNLFLVQFAYPIRQEWLEDLESCGAERIAYFAHRTLLVRVTAPEILTSCSASRYLAWVDAFRSSDRISGAQPYHADGEYTLQYIHGTDLSSKVVELKATIEVLDSYVSDHDKVAYLFVTAEADQLLPIVESDPDLLSVSRTGRSALSDERQGLIVAGIHNNAKVKFPGDPGFIRYRDWLNGRGLLNLSHQHVVAMVDTGYDDGSAPSTQITHHPDLESPERLDGIKRYSGAGTTGHDPFGHGTMVAGIIAGDGFTGTGGADSQTLNYGTGTAPGVKLYVAKFAPDKLQDLGDQGLALAESRTRPDGTDRAFIVNQSWNMLDGGANLPLNDYEERARFFDARVLDANLNQSGMQPMTIVFSAGNFRDLCNGLEWDTVASPATAKNVISVGATDSYRPQPDPPIDCRPCPSFAGRPKNDDASHIGNLADFSSRGKFFGTSGPYVHWTRVKPDLVAPGNRVFSTVPYQASAYPSGSGVNGCQAFYPDPPVTYHTYGAGTSFSAPVVSGVAALAREWFLDRSTSPSPSLVKAALIATADDLGDKGNNPGDHRPSPRYGWGRVNLDRLTDAVPKWYKSDTPSLAVTTGQSRNWTRTVSSGSRATYIVLVWSDQPTAVNGDSQVNLVNDLLLKVNGGTWRGNLFNEVLGTDNGYSYKFTVGTGGQDTINNVEAVFIPAGTFASGEAINLTVSGENVPTIGGQQFALYAYNVN